MKRVVLDTNVLVSAFVSAIGAPAQVFDLWRNDVIEIVTTQETLDELVRVLAYPKIRTRLRYSDDQIKRYLLLLRKHALYVQELPPLTVVEADPDDDKFLALAVASGATVVVSGDGHLLDLGAYADIVILSPAAFLDWLMRQSQ